MNQRAPVSGFDRVTRLLSRAAALVVLGWVATSQLTAAVLYWDTNAKTAGAGATPTGTWSTTKLWNPSSAGTSTTVAWTGGSDAVFSAGTDATGAYTVTVSGSQSVSSITVEDGNPTLTGGTISFSDATPDLIVNAGHTLTFGSALTSTTGNLNFSGGGIVSLSNSLTLAGTLTLGGGTLSLANTSYSFGTLNVTANSVIDFAGATTVNLSNLVIAAGVTLTVQNWTAASDFFYTSAWSGAVKDTGGSSPMNQVVFTGFSASNTQWWSADNEIRPDVPEPATYGAWLVGISGLLLGWRRRRA
jgi:hypothetical protein